MPAANGFKELRLYSVALALSFACGSTPARSAEPIHAKFQFEKTHRVLIELGGSGSFDECQAKYPSILKVGDEWWMWYNGRSDDCFTGSIGLAKSKDGLQWTKFNRGKPIFVHGPPGSPDSTKIDKPAVLQFGGKFHMWYTAGDDTSQYKIGYATSPDGISWKRENNGQPVLGPGAKGKFDDAVLLHPAVVRDDKGLLHIWYNGLSPKKTFRVGHATSRDGIHWQRQNNGDPVLEPSNNAVFKEEYVYNVYVLLERGVYHMWYSAWAKGERLTGPNHNCITYAVSRDGTRWKKDVTPTLANGLPESIDGYACFAPCVIRRSGELWMYFSTGSKARNGPYRTSLAKCRLSKPERSLHEQ